MKRFILALLLSLAVGPVLAQEVTVKNTSVYFSPHDGCTEAVVNALGAAQRAVLVQAYSFTPLPRLPKHWWTLTSEG